MATVRKRTLPSGLVRWQVDFTDQAVKRTGAGVPRAAGRDPAAHQDAGPVTQAAGKGRGDNALARSAPLRRVAVDQAGLLDQGGDDLRGPFLDPEDHGALRLPVPLTRPPKRNG